VKRATRLIHYPGVVDAVARTLVPGFERWLKRRVTDYPCSRCGAVVLRSPVRDEIVRMTCPECGHKNVYLTGPARFLGDDGHG
jgi:predicted RNA-binding Zn-ribbon protein involved in translation (DUF1610 family)